MVTRRTRICLAFLGAMLLAIAWSPLLSAEIDPEYNEKLTLLRARLTAEGFDTAYLDRLFADDRVVLYPEIVIRTGKGSTT